MDSTGGLVKTDKCKASWYNKIQKYFFLLKDFRNHHTPTKFRSLLVDEMVDETLNNENIIIFSNKVFHL